MQTERESAERHLSEPVTSLSVELTRISAEILSINSNFQDQLQHALEDSRLIIENHYKERFEKAVEEIRDQVRSDTTEELRKEFEAELERRLSHFAHVRSEIAVVVAQLEAVTTDIKTLLDDPNAELSRVMRKRAEQVELQSYLHGLRFSIGETH